MASPVKPHDIKDLETVMSIMKGADTASSMEIMTEKIKDNKNLLKWVDRDGNTALHVGILSQASSDKISVLLDADGSIASQKYRGRLPLHLALEFNRREEIITKLIDNLPSALQVADVSVDGRLPLHMVLESHPFPASFVELGMRVLSKYTGAAAVKSHEKLPLQVCLENGLQPRLTKEVLQAYRCAACVASKEGKLPLHLAVENNLDPRVIQDLIEANPAALMAKTICSGTEMTILEYAIRHGRSEPVIEAIMNGGAFVNAKCMAYARAAAVGRLTKEAKFEDTAVRSRTQFDTSNDKEAMVRERRRLQFKVKPHAGEEFTMEMCPEEKVETLKQKIQDREGTPADIMRLTLGGKQLMDGFELRKYNVQKGCTIYLAQRFEILQQALRHQAEAKITLQLLRLRPEAAREDDVNGVLPLQLAIHNNCEESVVKSLLAENRDAVKIPVRGGSSAIGEYPLHLALQKKYSPSVIEELLKNSVPLDWKPTGHYIPGVETIEPQCKLPLHIAIRYGGSPDHTKETISILLSKRCDISARDAITGHSALDECLAADQISNDLFGQIWHEIVKERPKIAEESGPNGQRPLHVAVVHNANQAIIEHLCGQGRDALDAYDVDKRLPIHLAVTYQACFAVVRTLLFHNPISINKTDGQGRTPLQLAVTHKAQPGVVFEITRKDSRTLAARDSRGRSLIELAVASDAPQWVVQELLEASPNEAVNLNLLSGKWPNTKASSEALRFAFEARKRAAREKQTASLFGTARSDGQERAEALANARASLNPRNSSGTDRAPPPAQPPLRPSVNRLPAGDLSQEPQPEEEEQSMLTDIGTAVGKWFGW